MPANTTALVAAENVIKIRVALRAASSVIIQNFCIMVTLVSAVHKNAILVPMGQDV